MAAKATVSLPPFVLKNISVSMCHPPLPSALPGCHETASDKNTIIPIASVMMVVKGMILLRTCPSLPRIPAVVVPRMILLGLMALPMEPPAVWAPRIGAWFR